MPIHVRCKAPAGYRRYKAARSIASTRFFISRSRTLILIRCLGLNGNIELFRKKAMRAAHVAQRSHQDAQHAGSKRPAQSQFGVPL